MLRGRWNWIVLTSLLLMAGHRAARAENYALLIGIDKYDHGLSQLGGAANDARALAQTLVDVCSFPAANVTVLVSDEKPNGRGAESDQPPLRPDRNGILQALTLLTRRVKPGDMVFLFYAGHGVQPGATPYLLPADCLDDEQNLTESALPITVFGQRLAGLKAKTLVMAFDMCRSLPFGGARDTQPDNRLSDTQVRGVQLAFQQAQEKRDTPLSTVMLFACSPKESSYEWREKKRGYFSYFLEQGLRCDGAEGGASDAQGVVKVEALVKYLQKAVPGAIPLHETRNVTQTPYPDVQGPEAMQTILATGRPHQSAGNTAVPLVVGKSADEQFNAAFQRGVELRHVGRFDAALVKFEDALNIRPNSAPTVYAMGEIQFRVENYAEAEKLYRKAMALDPAYASPVNGLANIYYLVKKNYSEAEKLFRKAIELDPKDGAAVNDLAMMYCFVTKDYVEAEKLFRRAIALDPKNASLVNDLAMIYKEVKKDYAEAERLYLKAVELDPKAGWLVSMLADFYYSATKDNAKAEKFYRQSMELDPRAVSPICGLANICYHVKKDYAEAERLYHKAMEIDPKHVGPMIGLAKLYRDVKKDYLEAERLYRKAIELEESPRYLSADSVIHADLAECLLKQNRREEAMQEAKKAIALGCKEPHPVFKELGLTP